MGAVYWDGNGSIIPYHVFQEVMQTCHGMTMVVLFLHTQCQCPDGCGDFGKIWKVFGFGKHLGRVLPKCFDPRFVRKTNLAWEQEAWDQGKKEDWQHDIWRRDMHEAPWPPNPYPAKYPALAPKEIAGRLILGTILVGVGGDTGGWH